MIIAGFDLSINSSGLVKFTLDDNLDVIDVDYLGFTQVKKWQQDKVLYFKKNQFRNYIEQNDWMLNHIKSFIGDNDLTHIAVEDYAYGATGKVFHIAEYAGLVKFLLWDNDKKIRLYDPNTIKIFASTRGNCDKITMHEMYQKLECDYKIDISGMPEVKTTSGASPTSDLIDAFFIAELLRTELKLRKGLIDLKSLDESLIKVFNRTTKAHPENILVEEYLERFIDE
jgi:Holliday junction resolvasome RuvABC endonuclease subunit